MGDRPDVKDNVKIGNFSLGGIPKAKAGVPQIKVTFSVDENSILTVSAKDEKTGGGGSLKIKNIQDSLFEEERNRMRKDAVRFEEQDKKIRQARDSRNALEKYCAKIKSSLENIQLVKFITKEDQTAIEEIAKECAQWVKSNSNAPDAAVFQLKRNEINARYLPIRNKIYKAAGISLSVGNDDEDLD